MLIDIIVLSLLAIAITATIIEAIIIRGFMRQEENLNNTNGHSLTGREIEYIRRKLHGAGMVSITPFDIDNLLLTLKEIQLGMYTDKDPYVPSDPYEDI